TSAGGAAGIDASSAAGQPAPPASPADPALLLEALMGQHSVLASDMMQARIRGDADLAQAANAALGQNTEAMARVVQPFVDAPAQKQFTEMWAEHILSLFDYARGHSIHDPAVREDAREESIEYEGELAEFFVDHSGGRLDRRLARVAVHDHAQHLLANADAYAAGRYASAAQGYRDSYAHSYDFGATLARALMPSTVTRALDTPSVRLRSALTGLLGEHAALVMAMTRSAAGAPDDFAAMGEALNGNTTDLTSAIDALFGGPAAQRFQSLWADQIDQLAAYNTAAVRRDTAGQERARAALRLFQDSLAGFLGAATSNRLAAPALVQALAEHDGRLLAEIDAYSAASFEQAYTLSAQIQGAMFTLSGRLADGIGTTVAARLPRGGSQTGGGGTARAAAVQ
ncbi:MAG: hypothetical protein WAL50_16840, partial [Kineosporiaceae bacterium]